MSNPLYQWYFELKRRKVFQTALAYFAAAWLLLQVTEIVTDALALPDWTVRLVLVLLLLGFPLVIVIAWVFDVGPNGMVRTGDSSSAMEWLAAVVWLHIPPLQDEVGNRHSKPRAALERRLMMLPSLWRRWQDNDGQLVFNNTHNAIQAAQSLRDFALKQQLPVAIGVAVGSVKQHKDQIEGEAVHVAEALARSAPAQQIHGTEQVHDELLQHPEMGGEFLGPLSVSALAHPVRMYRLQWQGETTMSRPDRRLWPGMVVAALLVAVMAVPLSWWLQHDAAPVALPELGPTAWTGHYVNIARFDDPGLGLSEAQHHGLRAQLNDVFQSLPSVYVADSEIPTTDTALLRTRIEREGETYSLLFELQSANPEMRARAFSVSGTTLQELFNRAQQTLSAQLALQFDIPAPSIQHYRPMPAPLFRQLLDANYALTDVPNRETLERFDRMLTPALAEQPDNQFLVVTHCHLLLLRINMLKEASAQERANDSCKRIASYGFVTERDRLVYANYLSQVGRENEAVREIEKALQINPRNSDAYELLANAHMQRGDALKAEHTLLKAITMQPGYWRPMRALARFQFNSGRYTDAAGNYQKVVDLAPNSGRAWSDLGAALFMAGKLGEAADALSRAVQLEASQSGYSNLGTLYYYLGRYSDAIRHYQLALKDSPDDFRLYGNIADTYRVQRLQGDAHHYYGLALEKLDAYLASAGDDIETRSLRLMYQHHRDEITDAYERMQQLALQYPSNAELELYLAILATEKRDNERVINHLKRAIELGLSSNLISVDPDFRYLGSDQRFIRLISQQNT